MKPEPLCYDDGGATADRYTIFPRGRGWGSFLTNNSVRVRHALSLSQYPCHPWGISQWCECAPGRHLGERVSWSSLPANIQRHVIARMAP